MFLTPWQAKIARTLSLELIWRLQAEMELSLKISGELWSKNSVTFSFLMESWATASDAES